VKPDLSDVFVFIGLIILATGLWMISPPVALIIVGVIIMLVGVLSAARRKGVKD
jgi:hypothetical protein